MKYFTGVKFYALTEAIKLAKIMQENRVLMVASEFGYDIWNRHEKLDREMIFSDFYCIPFDN